MTIETVATTRRLVRRGHRLSLTRRTTQLILESEVLQHILGQALMRGSMMCVRGPAFRRLFVRKINGSRVGRQLKTNQIRSPHFILS